MGYFSILDSLNRLRPLAHWIRRRLRALLWSQWKNRRTRVNELLKRGISKRYALTTGCARSDTKCHRLPYGSNGAKRNGKGAWRMSNVKWVVIALPDSYFESLGLVFPWL